MLDISIFVTGICAIWNSTMMLNEQQEANRTECIGILQIE